MMPDDRLAAERLASELGVTITVNDRVLSAEAPHGYVWQHGRSMLVIAHQDCAELWSTLLRQMRDGLRKVKPGEAPRHPR